MGLWVELHCDVQEFGDIAGKARCSSHRGHHPAEMFRQTIEPRAAVARVRDLARAAGFKRLRDGRWACPGCWLTLGSNT